MTLIRILLLSTLIFVSACAPSDDNALNPPAGQTQNNPQNGSPANQNPAQNPAQNPPTGDSQNVALSHYDVADLSGFDKIKAARVFYPQNTTATLPMVLMVHGYMGSGENLYLLAEQIAKHNMIVAVFTTTFHNNDRVAPRFWIPAYRQMIGIAKREAQSNAIDNSNKIALLGHSMGAGGLFEFADAASSVDAAVQTYVALAPYKIMNPALDAAEAARPFTGKKIAKPILMMSGSADDLTTEAMLAGYYQQVPDTTAKYWLTIANAEHNDYGNLTKDAARQQNISQYIIAWLKWQLKGQSNQEFIEMVSPPYRAELEKVAHH